MSYDITTNVGKVRLIIGDNDDTNEAFTDAEIDYFLTANSNDIYSAAADALEAWAAKYASAPGSEKIGDYAYTQKIIEGMIALAKSLRDKVASEPAGAAAEIAHTDFAARTIIINRALRTG